MGAAYFAPYGVGLGHASRLVMVADHLKENGSDLRFSSFGEAASYISLHGYRCETVAPVEFAWSLEGGFSVKYSIANIPSWFANFTRQVNQETRNLAAFKPDVVVSDSRLSPLFASRLVNIPSIVILNQVKLLLSPRLRELAVSRFFEDLVGELLGSMWTLADRVLIPDLPPPYTISAENVWSVGSATRKVEYIGFTSPRRLVGAAAMNRVASQLGIDRSRPVVFVHVSGPYQTRMTLVKIAAQAARQLNSRVQFVISEGRPNGKTEPEKVNESCWYYEWCPVRDEIFALSDLLVLRGGHVALSHAIQFGKPVVTVPIENHGEQLGNSAKIAELGMGVMLLAKGLKAEQFAETISAALADDRLKKRAEDMQRLAAQMDGIKSVVQIVKSFL